MDNSLVGRNLIDQILALREEVEQRLKQNQYYVAMTKLDELLAAIRPLDIIEGTATPAGSDAEPEPQGQSAPGSSAQAEQATPAALAAPAAPAEQEPQHKPAAAAAPQPALRRSWRLESEPEKKAADRSWHAGDATQASSSSAVAPIEAHEDGLDRGVELRAS
jgi:hypothetical protein